MKKPATLLEALRNHVDSHGDKTAFTFLKSDEETISISFRELDARAQQIARRLLTVARPGDRALLMYQAGITFIEAFLGCLYAGVVAVPAYPPKKNRNADRILTIAQDCTPKLLLCSEETRQNVEGVIVKSVPGASLVVTDQLPDGDSVELPELRSDQLAFLQYTSGSTASPKGVMVTHGNIVANELLIEKYFQFSTETVMVSWLPMFHDMGLIGGILGPLFVGAPSIVMAPNTFLRDPMKWLQTVSKYKATVTGAPNFAYELCAKRITPEQKRTLDLSSLNVAFNGSEPVRAETLERFTREFAECGFHPDAFFPCYGMAETTLLVSGGPPLSKTQVITVDLAQLEQHLIVETPAGRPLVSCGQIGPDLEVRIVNPETSVACSANEVGEIWAHGESVASGYWQRPEASLHGFQAKMVGDDRNWLRTGDYGFVRDETLYVTGRLKDLIIIRGRNIYPQDIEELVERRFDAIQPNCCAAFSVESAGEEKLLVIAAGSREMVRWSNSPHGPNGELVELNHQIDGLRSDILNEFEVALTDLVFVRPTTFPTTSSGKVQRQLTKRMFEGGQFDILFESEVRTPETVETSLSGSEELTSLICETLKEWSVDEEQRLPPLDGHTTFTSLGIDSLAAADIGTRLEKKLGCVIEADTLYDHHTIDELSQFLSRRMPGVSKACDKCGPLSQEDYLGFYKEKIKRIQNFRDAGHDYFGTPIGYQQGSYVHVGDRKMLMMASYSYLGLINRPEINQAAEEAIQSYGTGAHGVRLLAGTFDAHRELENEIADFFHSDDAIVYSSGFMTNLATVAALVGKGDVVLGDELNHASIVDGCQFSAATFEMFPHNDLQTLEAQLQQYSGKRILVIVDAVYSMEGDIAPLPEIVQLCRRYGAMLMVDEAHSLGVIGETGRGIQEHFNLPDDAIDIKMGTLSKSIASCGGFIAARQEIIDYLKCNARGFIFSASLPAAQVGAARKCFEIMRKEPHLAGQLRKLRDQFVNGLRELGYEVPATESAVVPIIFPTEQETLEATGYCRDNGLFVVPVFYPAVPMDKPRIRATVTASLTEDDVDAALSVFQALAIARSQTGSSNGAPANGTHQNGRAKFCDRKLAADEAVRPTR